MKVLNRCDIPSRYLRPYTVWVNLQLPKIHPSRNEQMVSWWSNKVVNEPTITAFAYYMATGDTVTISYREPGQPRQAGENTQVNHLNIFVPMGTPYSQKAKAEYIEKLKLRLFEVTIQLGAALGYFGREPLPDGPMPLYRQRVGALWMKEADTLLQTWKKGPSYENVTDEIEITNYRKANILEEVGQQAARTFARTFNSAIFNTPPKP